MALVSYQIGIIDIDKDGVGTTGEKQEREGVISTAEIDN